MKVTMVITTFNRGGLLDHSLRRLAELTLPDEVLVIDDGGDDDTEAVCSRWHGDLPINYLYNHNPGPTICSMARNIGVRQAQHDFLVTCEPELLYLTDIIARFKDLQPEHPSEIISAGHIYFAPQGWEPGSAPPGGAQEAVGWVAPFTALWYRPWLVEVGGWDETFPGTWGWDDTDLLTRLRYMGHGQFIDTEAVAVHQFHGLGGDPNFINEQHFFGKSFNHGNEKHHCSDRCSQDPNDKESLIANRGRAWGSITTRS